MQGVCCGARDAGAGGGGWGELDGAVFWGGVVIGRDTTANGEINELLTPTTVERKKFVPFSIRCSVVIGRNTTANLEWNELLTPTTVERKKFVLFSIRCSATQSRPKLCTLSARGGVRGRAWQVRSIRARW